MLLENIELKPNRILIQPVQNGSSSFSTESRKYDRKSVAVVKGVSKYIAQLPIGEKIIYDDSNSIDFTIDGVSLSIIQPENIVAYIKEDKNGQTIAE